MNRNSNEIPGSKKSALIVEDDSSTQKLIKIILEEAGFICKTACTGIDAIEAIKKHLADIIILDISMPVMSGEEFFLWLKSDPVYEVIPVIFLTAISSKETIARLLDLGAEDYIIKPFETSVFMARVRKALRPGRAYCNSGNIPLMQEQNNSSHTIEISYLGLIWHARVCNEKIFVSSVPICPECRIEFSVSQEWAGFLKKKYWICKKCKKKSSFSTRRLSDIYTTVRREFEKKISEQI